MRDYVRRGWAGASLKLRLIGVVLLLVAAVVIVSGMLLIGLVLMVAAVGFLVVRHRIRGSRAIDATERMRELPR